MVRRAARIDENQAAIVERLRALGASVQTLAAVGKGCPDILVGWQGRNYLMEIKRPLGPRGGLRGGSLTGPQRLWHGAWRGQVAVVRTTLDALAVLGWDTGGAK